MSFWERRLLLDRQVNCSQRVLGIEPVVMVLRHFDKALPAQSGGKGFLDVDE